MNGGMMKKGNNKMNEWDTDESVEWWNGGMMEVWKDVFILWQNIRIMKLWSDQITKWFIFFDLQLYRWCDGMMKG